MSIRGRQPLGYTIVEVMIFLAVSGALLAGALALVSGQRQRTEFSSAVRELDSQIRDVMNDVSTGYYSRTANFSCSAGAGGPVISVPPSGDNSQGSNEGCIFLGRGLQFTEGDDYITHTIVGLRQAGSPKRDVANLDEAKPVSIVPSAGNTEPDGTQTVSLRGGINVKSVSYLESGSPNFAGTIVFYSPFQKDGSGNLVSSGQQRIELAPIVGTTLSSDKQITANAIKDMPTQLVLNPEGGVVLCIDSGSSNQYALLTIGGNNRGIGTDIEILNGKCTAP